MKTFGFQIGLVYTRAQTHILAFKKCVIGLGCWFCHLFLAFVIHRLSLVITIYTFAVYHPLSFFVAQKAMLCTVKYRYRPRGTAT